MSKKSAATKFLESQAAQKSAHQTNTYSAQASVPTGPAKGLNPTPLPLGSASGTYGAPAPPMTGAQNAAASNNPGYEAMYNADVSGADNEYGNTIAGLQYGETRAGQDYGFTFGRDAAGNVDSNSFQVDPNNPFSKMALLSRSYQQEQAGNLNNYASMGQQNSGAYARQAANAKFGNDQANDALRKSFGDVMNASTLNRAGALNTKNNTTTHAAANRLGNYLG